MTIKVGINGPGRIGRLIIRQLTGNPNFDLTTVPYSSPEALARLLKNDSVHGRFDADVEYNNQEKLVSVNGKKINVPERSDHPRDIDWNADGVEMVFEVTGIFTDSEDLAGHLGESVKKVILGAPTKDKIGRKVDGMFVYGVNEGEYKTSDEVLSNASCTTNALAPVVKVVEDVLGIEGGFMSTTHAVTLSQPVLDSRKSKPEREAAAGANACWGRDGYR